MSVTYTTAAQRDALRVRREAGYRRPEPLLAATSLVAMLAIALASAGRLRALDASDAAIHGQVVNLNVVSGAQALEPAIESAFANPAERRGAAAELFRFISGNQNDRRTLQNVGAIARATVTRDGKSRALFTAADIARLKPFLTVRTREEFQRQVWLFGALYVAAFHVVAFFWRKRRARSDLVLLAAAHLLTAIGFAVLLSRADPLRDNLLFVRYAATITLGLGVMAAVSLVDVAAMGFISLSYLPLIAALVLSMVLIVFGHGPGNSPAKVNLLGVQPIEAIRLLLALFLAGYFARRWELLREVRSDSIRDVRLPAWIDVPRAEYLVPVLVGVTAALVFFFFQKDLGPALFLCSVFLAVYAVARGRIGMAVTGLLLLTSGFYLGYRLQPGCCC